MTGLCKEYKYLANIKEDYAFTKKSNGPEAKAHCVKCGKILRNVIKEAKKQHYRRLVAKFYNKVKTTWNIIKQETRKVHSLE
jgi:uncharacterized Zn finger protein